MVQTRKDHVRAAFVRAAAGAFVELGYDATSMAAVAERAGSSVGNLYKYFASKQELFDAAVPPELVEELARRTRARMRALGAAKDVRELESAARYHALADELLDYCLAHRAAVAVVLGRAEGTRYADFRARFVERLVEWSLEYAREAYPALMPTPALRFVLRHAYESFVSGLVEVLVRHPSDERARELVTLVTHHHQGGLKRLFEACTGDPHAQSHQPEAPSELGKAARTHARNTRPAGTDPRAPRASAGQAHRPRRSGGRR